MHVHEDLKATVHQYTSAILRLCFAYLKNRADAKDIAQEVFLAYLLKKPRFNAQPQAETVFGWRCRGSLRGGSGDCVLCAAGGGRTRAAACPSIPRRSSRCKDARRRVGTASDCRVDRIWRRRARQ